MLVVAGFGVYGWIVPWRQQGVPGTRPGMLVEEETGNRYVYVDGMLRPTPDLPAALLWQGASAKVKLVSRASLAGVPRGLALGIPVGPAVSRTETVLHGPWLACRPTTRTAGGWASNSIPARCSRRSRRNGSPWYGPVGTIHLLTKGTGIG